jgi:pantetheine-phosphate adenylyltransferase
LTRIGALTGTFDPLTLGHMDILRRAMGLCDKLVVGVSTNAAKAPLFTLEQRVTALKRELATFGERIEVREFAGLAVDFAREAGAQFIVRGLRSGSDLDYERPMAAMNATMAPEVETIFLTASPDVAHIASSLVKDVALGGGAIGSFVPPGVADDIRAAMR